ncbi:MAG: tRNA (adenosine(37)-N6)-threonylcarbamoyltransferase complex dimerization subunit type 1 TsaB [Ignavibacteriaceae bacterium]
MTDLLPILAIETSDNICGACVYFDDAKYFSSKILLKHSHSEKLFEVISLVMKQAEIEFSDIKSLAVSAGPGSFTGLRIGMAAAKGIAEASSIPIIPVPTFEALALQVSKYLPEDSSFIIANKVGKDEVYFGRFYLKSNNPIFQEELKIMQNTGLINLSDQQLIFGNFNRIDLAQKKNLKTISAPDPEFIAKWAALNGDNKEVIDFDYLEPNYLKEFLVKEKKL